MAVYLAPSAKWSALTNAGVPAVYGKLFTYEAGTNIPKSTFAEVSGTLFNTNPVVLDGAGEAFIYWDDSSLYYVELYDENDQLIWTQDNYPVVSAGGNNTINNFLDQPNLVQNPQFTYFNGPPVLTNCPTGTTVAPNWSFFRSNENATIALSFPEFSLGQTDVPDTPSNYFQYECSAVGGGGEIFKNLSQFFPDVNFLNNTEVVIQFWARSSTSSTLPITFNQNFGAGGSAVVTTLVTTAVLDPTWKQYTGTVTIPTTAGKTQGDGNNLELLFNFPLNAIATIEIANIQLQRGNVATDFILNNPNQQLLDSQIVGDGIFQTGDVKLTISTVTPPGWVYCNDTTLGSPASGAFYAFYDTYALFTLLWILPEAYIPIFDSAGNPSTRGASALDDYNANKRLSLPRLLGRALASGGTGAGLTARALGEFLGEETHTLTIPEMPTHTHDVIAFNVGSGFGNGGNFSAPLTQSGPAGGDAPHNNMQPTTFLNCFIKL